MQINAIQSMVAQMANVRLIPTAEPVVQRRTGYSVDRMREMGKKIVELEAQGHSQRQIGERLSLSRSCINAYSRQYKTAQWESLM